MRSAEMPKRKYTPLPARPPPVDEACPEPTIHNIVSTSQIKADSTIDLPALSRLLPYSFYDRATSLPPSPYACARPTAPPCCSARARWW